MEYLQASRPVPAVTTLHDFGTRRDWSDLPLEDTAVVVPLTGADCGRSVTADVLDTLATVGVGSVVIPVRASADRIGAVRTWLEGFDLPSTTLWCQSPGLEPTLRDAGITTAAGKGRDVWLAVGLACERAEYVVVHDADVGSYTRDHVPRLLWPLTRSASFSKGYYARIEDDRLYGRLFRLFYRPLIATLRAEAAGDGGVPAVLEFLDTLRYALAGDVGFRSDLARECRFEPDLGLEVGTLGEVYEAVGPGGVAQVDLGRYTHDHRPVEGSDGLAAAAETVGGALGRLLEDQGVTPAYERLPDRYRERARGFVAAYAEDARFNGLGYDVDAELRQVERYADAIRPPGPDRRLPAWSETEISPAAVLEATRPLPE